MKKLLFIAIACITASQVVLAQTKAGKQDSTQHATYYTCPHHPDMVSDKPGKCAKCSMALTQSGKEQMKAGVTKTYACRVHVDVTRHNPGKCPQCGRKLHLSTKEQMKAQAMKIYTCPHHPDVALDKDGKCPKCGTALTEKKNE
jgi:histidinol phosphatase-like enzyme